MKELFLSFVSTIVFLCFQPPLYAQCAVGAEPEAAVFTIQPSCGSDGATINADGFVQISSVVGGLSYSVNEGDSFDGTGPRTDIGTVFPVQILTGLTNPTGSRDYNVRIYLNNAAGDASCFTDITVTMNEQDCSIGCNCEEMVYLNEPTTDGAVHKFLVNSDGSFTEISSASGGAWFDNATEMEELNRPHGLAVDFNGFVYIGESEGANHEIRRFTCDGQILPETEFGITTLGQFNLGSIGTYLYSNTPGGPFAINRYNLCEDALFPNTANGENAANPPSGINFCTVDSDGNAVNIIPSTDWGMYVDQSTEEFYVTQGFFSNSGSNYVWRFTADDFDGSSCIEPLDMGPDFPTLTTGIQGITLDGDGNIYIVVKRDNRPVPPSPLAGASYIMKFGLNAAGDAYELLAQSDPDNASDGDGYHLATGIIYSETTNRIYVSTESLFDACVAEFDTDLNHVAETVPAPGNNDNGKGIAITKECCPTNTNQTVNINQCVSDESEAIFLNEIFPCEGVICEGIWEAADAPSMEVYDPCNQTITPGVAAVGCYSFTRSSDGTGFNSRCGAFIQTLNVSIGQVTASVLGGNQEVCVGGEPNPFTVLTPATGSDDLSFQWFISTQSDSTGFTPIAGAITEVFLPTSTNITSDTSWFRSVVNITDCNGNLCADTSNTVSIVATLDIMAEAGNGGTVCRSAAFQIMGASIVPNDLVASDGTDFGATWTSSGTGDFLSANGTILVPPVRLADATSYAPSTTDISAGSVTLTLTTDDPDVAPFDFVSCEPVTDQVVITILNIDCGSFPWEGN